MVRISSVRAFGSSREHERWGTLKHLLSGDVGAGLGVEELGAINGDGRKSVRVGGWTVALAGEWRRSPFGHWWPSPLLPRRVSGEVVSADDGGAAPSGDDVLVVSGRRGATVQAQALKQALPEPSLTACMHVHTQVTVSRAAAEALLRLPRLEEVASATVVRMAAFESCTSEEQRREALVAFLTDYASMHVFTNAGMSCW